MGQRGPCAIVQQHRSRMRLKRGREREHGRVAVLSRARQIDRLREVLMGMDKESLILLMRRLRVVHVLKELEDSVHALRTAGTREILHVFRAETETWKDREMALRCREGQGAEVDAVLRPSRRCQRWRVGEIHSTHLREHRGNIS